MGEHSLAGAAIAVFLGYEFADFGSGVDHWSLDNYGSKDTPIWGTQIEGFQGHHTQPWTITHRDTANNLASVCVATTPFLVGFGVFCNQPFVLIWALTASTFISLSQELHKWSHSHPDDLHPIVLWLQDRGLILSKSSHMAHHKKPFENNYCIVSGHCNPLLDKKNFFRNLENLVERVTGNKPRCET